jgi:hypothetical protein
MQFPAPDDSSEFGIRRQLSLCLGQLGRAALVVIAGTRTERLRLAYSCRPFCKHHFGLCSYRIAARLHRTLDAFELEPLILHDASGPSEDGNGPNFGHSMRRSRTEYDDANME